MILAEDAVPAVAAEVFHQFVNKNIEKKEKELKILEKQKLKEGKNKEKLKPQNQTNANEESVESSGN